jgi:hypothetical protein
MKCRTLYRPVGLKELELISESGWRRFPPRLQWQPVFYPVLNQAYAEQIAREWNTEDAFSGYCGVVTAFDINEVFLSTYPVQNVGGKGHDELWIPAQDLEAFNEHIEGGITVVAAFFGSKFRLDKGSTLFAILEKFRQ